MNGTKVSAKVPAIGFTKEAIFTDGDVTKKSTF
jgi:hypothetical protein